MSKKAKPKASKPATVTWSSVGGLTHVELSDDMYPGADRRKRLAATVNALNPDQVTVIVQGGMMMIGSATFTRDQLRRFVDDLKPMLYGGFSTYVTEL